MIHIFTQVDLGLCSTTAPVETNESRTDTTLHDARTPSEGCEQIHTRLTRTLCQPTIGSLQTGHLFFNRRARVTVTKIMQILLSQASPLQNPLQLIT